MKVFYQLLAHRWEDSERSFDAGQSFGSPKLHVLTGLEDFRKGWVGRWLAGPSMAQAPKFQRLCTWWPRAITEALEGLS